MKVAEREFKTGGQGRFSPGGNVAKQALTWSPRLSAVVEGEPLLTELKGMLDQGETIDACGKAQDLLKALKAFSKKERPIIEAFLLLVDGDFKFDSGAYDDAEKTYTEAFKGAQKSGDKLLQATCLCVLGLSIWTQGKYEEALKQFDRAVKLNSKYVEAWLNRGAALIELGKHKKAVECFDKALKVDLNNALAWCNKGAALVELGKHKDAITELDKALVVDESDALAWYNKGLALERLGKYEEAAACFENAFASREHLPNKGAPLYVAWAELMLSQGMKFISSNDMKSTDRLILDFKRLSASATSDGKGQIVEEAINRYKAALPKGKLKSFSLFEYKLQATQEAIVRWGALRDWVSRKWPKGLSVVGALREERA